MARLILIIACMCALFSCLSEIPEELVLFDFESDSELDRFHWKCHTLFSLSDKHVSHGAKSLRLELYPSPYPGLVPMLKKNDWRGFKALCLDIYNPEQRQIQLAIRIDDQKQYPDYDDRYNKAFTLMPEWNRITIPMNTLVTSGTKRNLDQKNIFRVLFFLTQPKSRVVLYIDHIRLSS